MESQPTRRGSLEPLDAVRCKVTFTHEGTVIPVGAKGWVTAVYPGRGLVDVIMESRWPEPALAGLPTRNFERVDPPQD